MFLRFRAFVGSANVAKQAPNPSNVLGVFGLSIRTVERDLDEEFSRFGRVEKVVIVYDQRVSDMSCSLHLFDPHYSSRIVPVGSVLSRCPLLRKLLGASKN